MAIFLHGNRSIPYQTQFAPFAHDLLLLQSSKFSPDLWLPILDDLRDDEYSSGRIVTCEWFEAGLDVETLAEDLNSFLQTLGLHTLHVVACDDAVKVINELGKMYPGSVDKTLLFPHALPKQEDLLRAVREFSGI